MISERRSQVAFMGISGLLFAASVVVTTVWCGSMSKMRGMPMPGAWTMSMAWMRMPGQTWPGAVAAFLGMWIVMMAAMMLPSLIPVLRRYREARLTGLVAAGYFFVWTVLGLPVFVLGSALAAMEMREPALARAAPAAAALTVLLAGALQFTRWKAHHLACWRKTHACGCMPPADLNGAWRYGLRLGIRCCYCCASLTAVLLAVGVMDLRAMSVVTAAITAECIAPNGQKMARIVGYVVIAAGLLLTFRATVPG